MEDGQGARHDTIVAAALVAVELRNSLMRVEIGIWPGMEGVDCRRTEPL